MTATPIEGSTNHHHHHIYHLHRGSFFIRAGICIRGVERCPTHTHTHNINYQQQRGTSLTWHSSFACSTSFHWHTTLIFILVSDLNTLSVVLRCVLLDRIFLIHNKSHKLGLPLNEPIYQRVERKESEHPHKKQQQQQKHVALSNSNRKWIGSDRICSSIFFFCPFVHIQTKNLLTNTKTKTSEKPSNGIRKFIVHVYNVTLKSFNVYHGYWLGFGWVCLFYINGE